MVDNAYMQLIEKLSAYLDGELDAKAAARLEQVLATDASMRARLADLETTRAVLRRAGRRRVPRSFVLRATQSGVRAPEPPSVGCLRLSSAVMAVVFVGLLALRSFSPQIGATPEPALMTAKEVPTETAPLALFAAPLDSAAVAEATPLATEIAAPLAAPMMAARTAQSTELQVSPQPLVPDWAIALSVSLAGLLAGTSGVISARRRAAFRTKFPHR